MSTAAPPQKTQSTGYDVARPMGQCSVCATAIAPEARFMAALAESPEGFARIDTCLECWPRQKMDNLVAFWQTAMPRPEAKKKLFVDDTILCELFERLNGVEEPAKVNFRFVLGLILMRKRLVVYEGTRRDGEREIWVVRLRGREDHLDLANPRLDEEKMREVSEQLNEILHQEL